MFEGSRWREQHRDMTVGHIYHSHSFISLDLYLIRQVQPTERPSSGMSKTTNKTQHKHALQELLSHTKTWHTEIRTTNAEQWLETIRHYSEAKAPQFVWQLEGDSTSVIQTQQNRWQRAGTLKRCQTWAQFSKPTPLRELLKQYYPAYLAFAAPSICITLMTNKQQHCVKAFPLIYWPPLTEQTLMEEHCRSCCKTRRRENTFFCIGWGNQADWGASRIDLRYLALFILCGEGIMCLQSGSK